MLSSRYSVAPKIEWERHDKYEATKFLDVTDDDGVFTVGRLLEPGHAEELWFQLRQAFLLGQKSGADIMKQAKEIGE